MKTYDNQGKLHSEINTTYTQDGVVVTTNTLYNANGQAVSQTISVRDSQGKVTTQTTLGGKLLPEVAMSCRWVVLPSCNTVGRFCGKPGHPYCPDHQREMDAMEQSDKDWDDILATHEAVCREPKENQ